VFVLILTVIYFRFYPAFYLSGLAARQEVYNAERSTLKKTIEAKYPICRPASAKLLDRLFDEMLKTEKPEINAKIAHKARNSKALPWPRGKIYLNGIDSYYWLRLLNNLLKSGHIGDRNSRHWVRRPYRRSDRSRDKKECTSLVWFYFLQGQPVLSSWCDLARSAFLHTDISFMYNRFF